MSNKRRSRGSSGSSVTTLSSALSSPMRLEIVTLFSEPGPLSITEMAQRLGRPATSLYHHVQILEDAGVLRRTGTRPKGKRFEALFEPAMARLELDANPQDEAAARQVAQTMSSALRMTERDFLAAIARDDVRTEGKRRNLIGLRTHMRLSPKALAKLNEHLDAFETLLPEIVAESCKPGPRDTFVSLTFALAPLRGRRVGDEQDRNRKQGATT